MTAFALLLSGAGLAFTAAGRRRAALLCAALVLLIAALVLMEYATARNFGIDELLGRDYLNLLTSHRGRMSPVSALCFLAIGLSLILTARLRPTPPASTIVGVLSSSLTAVGTVSALGHLLGYMETYGWSQLTRMSPFTSAGVVLLGAGLMSWAWQEGQVGETTPRWLPLGLGLGLATGALGAWQALIAHERSELMMISHTILAGGLIGAVLVAIAVAQAQQARKRSREIEARGMMLHQLFEAAPDGLIMLNQQGKILRVNQKAEEMFGYPHDDVLGMLIESLFPGALRDLHRTSREHLYAAPSTRPRAQARELRACRKDGSEFPVEISLTPVQSAQNEPVVVAVVRDMSERKQAEEALLQSEERFRSVFEQGPTGIALIGGDHRMVKVNSAFCEMLGYTEEELTRMTPLEITHPEDRPETLELIEHLLRSDFPVARTEKRYLKKNGEVLWASLSSSVIRDRAGEPLYGVGMIQDITERKRADAALQLGNAIFAHMEEAVCLVRVEDRVIVHANPKFEKMFGYGPGELAGKQVEVINADHHRRPEEVSGEITEEIRRSGVWRGEILHRRKDGTPFWCAVMVSVFHHPEYGEVGVSIHQDITNLKRAREALEESEERFRGVFEQGPIGVALLDADHRMTKTNPAFCRMLGYSEAELAKMTPLDMIHPDDRESCAKLLGQLDTGEIPVCRMEQRYIKKNGEIMWAGLTASVVRDRQGRPVYGLGMVEDITERKHAEQKIAEQAALLDLAPDLIAVRDLQGKIIFWNRGGKNTYGWSPEEAIGRMPQELVHSKYPIPLKEIEAIVLAQGSWEGELEQLTREGRPIVVASRWSLWRDDHGAPKAILVINRDITERKRAEEQLRSLTERLFLATRSAWIGIWDWDLRTNTTVWDDTHFEIFGIPKVVPMPYEEFVRCVYPEDLPKVQASLQRAIQGKTQDFVEFRILRPDGSVRHISSAEGVVLDEHDKVVRVVGTAMDITERKRMEAQIEANKAQLITSARLSALGMMAGNIAHEINNPVGIIHALASNLIDMAEQDKSVPPETVAGSAKSIRETSERIAGIVRSLLQISREGSSERFFPASISKILKETLEISGERFRANGIKLILPAQVPEVSVACRETRIAEALLNLLQNAFDAVVEQKDDRWVRLDVTQHDDSVEISVIDGGPGIPAELQPRIMEPFFTTKPVGKGTGLGLSLSKTIAEEHGGRLEFGEDHGRTRFSLVLPIGREADRSPLIQTKAA